MLRNRVMNTLLDLTLTREDNLLKKFEEIHNYIYANDGLSPQQVLEEFIKVLFIKIYDENQPTPLFLITEDEWNLHKTGSIIVSLGLGCSILVQISITTSGVKNCP